MSIVSAEYFQIAENFWLLQGILLNGTVPDTDD